MKTSFQSLRNYVFILAFVIAVAGCNQGDDPAPSPKGTLLTYTNIAVSQYDRIDVIVDGKVVGKLTAPFVVKPSCGAGPSASVVSIDLPVGTHKVYAIQYKNGKHVGEWTEENEVIREGKCTPLNWTE
jgi:hypothetical protein